MTESSRNFPKIEFDEVFGKNGTETADATGGDRDVAADLALAFALSRDLALSMTAVLSFRNIRSS